MIVQSVFIGKPVDYSPGDCKVYGVLTIAYKKNKYWICVGEFDQAYLRPKTVMLRRNKTCWTGKYGVPFNDDHQYIRMIAEDSYSLLHQRLYGRGYEGWETEGVARTLEEVQNILSEKSDYHWNPVIWSTRRIGPHMLDPANPKNIIYNQPVITDLFNSISFPDASLEEIRPLVQEAIDRCLGQLLSEVILATADYHFQNEGEWDFLINALE